MRVLRLLRVVLWSFFGVRRGADAARDMEGVQPHMVLMVGVLVAAVFVIAIVSIVRLVIGGQAAQEPPPPVAQGVAAPPPAPANARGPVVLSDTMGERVKPCTVCHRDTAEVSSDGFSPRIAGKPSGYLFNQLVSFRDGRRTNPQMVYLVQYMSDAYLRDIAVYFSQQDLPYPPAEPATLPADALARARALIEQGDAARGVPACVACHGHDLTGSAPAIPGLLGLPRHYLQAQFGGWRSGRLRSLPPDCMAEVARRLAPDDVPILAAWLASQPVPHGMKPGAPPAAPLPLQCGGVLAATR